MSRPLHVLVTGFGPFPQVPVNPTAWVARALAQDKRFARLGLRVSAHVFATRWSVLDDELPQLLATMRPDAVLHLGVAARRRAISVEIAARSGSRRLLPDAGGTQSGGTAAAGITAGTLPLRIAAPAAAVAAAIARSGAPVRLSNSAGRYLCNALYAGSLAARQAAGEKRPTLFLHVPLQARPAGTMPAARVRSRRLSLAAMTAAIAPVLPVLARAARRADDLSG